MLILFTCVFSTAAIWYTDYKKEQRLSEKACVFRTVFGEEANNNIPKPIGEDVLDKSVTKGIEYLLQAQHNSGGWGAGSHSRQDITDPHAVEADPATTSMVAMALLRTSDQLVSNKYEKPLRQSTEFLLKAIEQAGSGGHAITQLKGTQIQRKLGQNIDLVLTIQYLSNLLQKIDKQDPMYDRIYHAVNKGVDNLENFVSQEGKIDGAGWAGVLQSSLANTALESAEIIGAKVDQNKLDQIRSNQKDNYNPKSKTVATSDGAGVVLYAVSGSVRGASKEAKKAKLAIEKAKKQNILSEDEEINTANLQKAGMSEKDAIKLAASYEVYESAKVMAQQDKVVKGFGNNGGEEFISYLQTGESLAINQDETWQNWFNKTSTRIMDIQLNNGSWKGHHCITSPVFCTATCVLLLNVNKDIAFLSEGNLD